MNTLVSMPVSPSINTAVINPTSKVNGCGCPYCGSPLYDSAFQTSTVKIDVECKSCEYRGFRRSSSYKTQSYR